MVLSVQDHSLHPPKTWVKLWVKPMRQSSKSPVYQGFSALQVEEVRPQSRPSCSSVLQALILESASGLHQYVPAKSLQDLSEKFFRKVFLALCFFISLEQGWLNLPAQASLSDCGYAIYQLPYPEFGTASKCPVAVPLCINIWTAVGGSVFRECVGLTIEGAFSGL